MARKLLLIIFALTVAALELLSIRQSQIIAVHTMTVLHQDIAKQEATLDALRFEIEKESSIESLGVYAQEITQVEEIHE
ncbi:MAG: hypothetical protein QGI78_08135 [Phycisphaerales bacterium]|jgi:cell division protein FtsB|nr:hypothetical protein [Phycisphaerales bacterium]